MEITFVCSMGGIYNATLRRHENSQIGNSHMKEELFPDWMLEVLDAGHNFPSNGDALDKFPSLDCFPHM